MATYLPGETSIIPALQPFNPDLNMVSAVLQQKQSQFDSNYKYLNKIYNTYVFSDLSREDNIKKRDNYVKQMDADLKRISGLDLSQQKNVDAAARVFAPLYEDSYLMTDMAKTKNYKSNRGSATALQNSLDPKQRAQYWGEGVQYMDYMMDDFKRMPIEETLSSPDIKYVPWVNVAEKLQAVAKDNNLSVEADSFTKDGMYIVTDKNGALLVDPLTRLFSQTITNDPAIQENYRVRAYLQRKNTIQSTQAQFGSLEAAEQNYLIGQYNELTRFSTQWNEKNNRDLRDKDNTIRSINKSYQDGTYNETTAEALQEQQQSKERIQNEVNQSTALAQDLSNGESSTLSLYKEPTDITQNIALLRNVVDNGTSVLLMNNDIVGSAEALAFKDVKHKINVNSVGLENLRHSHRTSEIDRRAKHNENALVLKNNLDNGTWITDQYGTVQANPELTARLTKKFNDGTTTGAINPNQTNTEVQSQFANEKATPAVKMMFEYLENEIRNGMSPQQAGAFFSYQGKTLQEVKSIYEKNPGAFFVTRGFNVQSTMNKFNNYAQTTKKGDATIGAIVNSAEYASLGEYEQFAASAKKVQNKNVEIARKLASENIYEAGLMEENNFFSADIQVAKSLTGKERQILNDKLPQYFISNLSGPNKYETFMKLASKDKELGPIISKMNTLYGMQKTKEDNVVPGPLNPIPFLAKAIGGFGTDGSFLERVYEKYNANYETKQNSTKFETYYTGTYVPGASGSEYALKATEAKGLTVFPNAYGTPNRNVWTETMIDLNNMSSSFGTDNNKISFNGIGKSAANDTKTGLAILSHLNNKMAGKEKPGQFEMYASTLAMEDPKKAAMLVYPTADILKELVGTKDNPGIITAEQRNSIMKNGISIINDRNSFNNFLMKENAVTPMQATINAGGYTYKNPGGAGYFTINQTSNGYAITGQIGQRDATTGKKTFAEINQIASFGQYGNNIDALVTQLQQNLVAVAKQNNSIYRKFNPVNR